jgi:iron complex transport system substrate-binding protein
LGGRHGWVSGGEDGEEGAHEDAKARRGEGRQRGQGGGGEFIWFLLFVPTWLRVQSRGMENRGGGPIRGRGVEEVATEIVDCAFRIHRDLGPGLLESVYETVLSKLLEDRGLTVQRQHPVSIFYEGRTFREGFRADLIVNRAVLIELKSVEALAPVHYKQTLTYLRLLQLPLGFLINFGAPTLREGCRRIVNGPPNLIRPDSA